MKIGKSIKIALAKSDMSQGDLAAKMEVGQPFVSKIIGGKKITVETLAKIAGAFDMKVSEFLALGEE